jgi:NADPH-dependent curcumin reductase CurA
VTIVSRQFHLVSRPTGTPRLENFELVERVLDRPVEGQLLVRNHWLSVDPYMRGRMSDQPSYVPPFELNEPMDGAAIGEVIESGDGRFARGDMISHFAGWRDYALVDAASARKIGSDVPPQAYLGPLGFPGLAAYVGLLKIGALKERDTVFVSAAAGTVGSLVAQIAKIKGCRVIGSTGSEEKERWLREDLGIDAVLNYKRAGDLTKALADVAPDGIDVYFDNVGGENLEAAIEFANDFARFPLCGMISQYNREPVGPRNIYSVVTKRIKLQGLVVTDHLDVLPEFQRDVEAWISEGKVTWRDTVVDDLENTPSAFLDLFTGKNIGKMLVRLDGVRNS